jgi:hypothetical protein
MRRLKKTENGSAGMADESVISETTALDRVQVDRVVGQARADRDEACREFTDKCDDCERQVTKEEAVGHFTFADLEDKDADPEKRHGRLERVRRLDFDDAPLGVEAKARHPGCEAMLDGYARRIFAAHDESC